MAKDSFLRKILIFLTFAAGMGLIFFGFFMTASTKGLLIMLAGVALLLFAMFVYNIPFFVKKD